MAAGRPEVWRSNPTTRADCIVGNYRHHRAAERAARKRNSHRKSAPGLEPTRDDDRAWDHGRCPHAYSEQSVDREKFSEVGRTAEHQPAQTRDGRAHYHHLFWIDSIREPSDQRSGRSPRDPSDREGDGELRARPSEVLEDRNEENRAGIYCSPDKEHREKDRTDDDPSPPILFSHGAHDQKQAVNRLFRRNPQIINVA